MKTNETSYCKVLQELLIANENEEIAYGAAKYMKNQFPFYGIKAPVRKEILKQFIQGNGLPKVEEIEGFVKYAWAQPQREWQYLGMEILEKVSSKNKIENLTDIAQYIIENKSWWDTVDFIASNIVGKYFLKNLEKKVEIIEKWRYSNNLWLQRTCIIHQLKYKSKTDENLLYGLCMQLAEHSDFFIRKAIGWALREYSKTNPNSVANFVKHQTLSKLSYREATKYIQL